MCSADGGESNVDFAQQRDQVVEVAGLHGVGRRSRQADHQRLDPFSGAVGHDQVLDTTPVEGLGHALAHLAGADDSHARAVQPVAVPIGCKRHGAMRQRGDSPGDGRL